MAATKLGSRNCYSGEKNVRTHLHLWHIPLRYRKAGRPRAVLHRNKSINNYAAKHSQKAAHSSTFFFFFRRFLDKRGLCTTRGNSVSTISPGTLVGKKKKNSAECRHTSYASALESVSAISLSAVTPKLVCPSQNRMLAYTQGKYTSLV